jgi:HSP20 family protein
MALPVRRREVAARPQQRWQPFSDLQQLQEETARLMESVLGPDAAGVAAWAPPVDIEETDDAWVIEAELPGVKKDDINVEVRDNEVEISGDIKERERQGILRRRTRKVGRFEFRVSLPGAADPNDIEANLDHGVLTLRIPKPSEARPQRIEVNSAA